MPDLLEMFSDAPTGADAAARLELFKSAMSDSHKSSLSGRTRFADDHKSLVKAPNIDATQAVIDERFETITKSLSADALAGLGTSLADLKTSLMGELTKDWTPTNPNAAGLVPFDLEPMAKLLVPRDTPWRNSIPRTQGKGTAHLFKRILSWTNAGIPGGAATLSPFFNSLTQVVPFGPTGNISLARPQKISYTSDTQTVAYVEMGFSDSVDYVAQFEALGFADLRSLSHTAALWAHLQGEERAMLYSRGASGAGFSGSVAAPVVTVGTATTGGTIPAATYNVYVTAVAGFGESNSSTLVTQATTGATSTLTVTIATEPAGSEGIYNVYLGTTGTQAAAHYQGTFSLSATNTIVLTTYNAAGLPAAPVTDTSFVTGAYDGFIPVQLNPANNGYIRRLNNTLSTSNPGAEIDLALATMWTNVASNPDEIWVTGAIRNEINQSMRAGGANGAASGYRTEINSGGQVTMGTIVTGYVNGNTGKILDLHTHRFLPQGTIAIRSTSVPYPDANVSAPIAAVNVQDYMAIDWPQIQLTYDISTYQIGTLVHYAPFINGIIVGVS